MRNRFSRALIVAALLFSIVALPARSYASAEWMWHLHHLHHMHHLTKFVYNAAKNTHNFVFGPEIFFAPIIMAAMWHIPHWEACKKDFFQGSKERGICQAEPMWPQQLFAKLPGGSDYAGPTIR